MSDGGINFELKFRSAAIGVIAAAVYLGALSAWWLLAIPILFHDPKPRWSMTWKWTKHAS